MVMRGSGQSSSSRGAAGHETAASTLGPPMTDPAGLRPTDQAIVNRKVTILDSPL